MFYKKGKFPNILKHLKTPLTSNSLSVRLSVSYLEGITLTHLCSKTEKQLKFSKNSKYHLWTKIGVL